MNVGGLAWDLREQNLSRVEDSLLVELDDISIGKFIAFLL